MVGCAIVAGNGAGYSKPSLAREMGSRWIDV